MRLFGQSSSSAREYQIELQQVGIKTASPMLNEIAFIFPSIAVLASVRPAIDPGITKLGSRPVSIGVVFAREDKKMEASSLSNLDSLFLIGNPLRL